MGSFYTNITLRDASVPAVVSWLAERTRSAAVGDFGRFVVIYDELGEAQDGSHAWLAAELSVAFETSALAAMNHDDDVLRLHLFDHGSLVGEYDSDPGYFDPYFSPDEEVDLAEVAEYERLTAEREAARGPALNPGDLVSRFGGNSDVVRVVLEAGIDGGDVPPEMSADGYLFANDRHAALAEAIGLKPASVLVGHHYITQGERPAGGEIHVIE